MRTREVQDRLPDHVLQALVAGDLIHDFEFDQILPEAMRDIADAQWTSVRAARIIADMLKSGSADAAPASFIDLGCGVGKLCLLLALSTDLKVSGIERRPNLVKTCRRLFEANAPGRIDLIQGDLLELDWNRYDVLYLFNPFQEQKLSKATPNLIDTNLELGEAPYRRTLEAVSLKLKNLKSGQRVITFHGYGGMMPESLTQIAEKKVDNGTVRLWQK